jgi:hypothetical protein
MQWTTLSKEEFEQIEWLIEQFPIVRFFLTVVGVVKSHPEFIFASLGHKNPIEFESKPFFVLNIVY